MLAAFNQRTIASAPLRQPSGGGKEWCLSSIVMLSSPLYRQWFDCHWYFPLCVHEWFHSRYLALRKKLKMFHILSLIGNESKSKPLTLSSKVCLLLISFICTGLPTFSWGICVLWNSFWTSDLNWAAELCLWMRSVTSGQWTVFSSARLPPYSIHNIFQLFPTWLLRPSEKTNMASCRNLLLLSWRLCSCYKKWSFFFFFSVQPGFNLCISQSLEKHLKLGLGSNGNLSRASSAVGCANTADCQTVHAAVKSALYRIVETFGKHLEYVIVWYLEC